MIFKSSLQKALFNTVCAVFTVLMFLESSAIAEDNTEKKCFSGSGEEVLAACQQLLDDQGNSLKLYKRISDILNELKHFDESLKILGMARKEYPGNKRVAFRIKLTKSMEAEQILFAEDDASQKNKEQVKQTKIKHKVSRLLCLRVKGDRGLEACETAIKTDPGDHALFQAYGDLLHAAGKKKLAENAYATAKKLQGKSDVAQKVGEKEPPQKPTAGEKNKPESTPDKALAETDPVSVKLRKLKSLFEQQLIDESEYQTRRTALLDKTFGKSQARKKSFEDSGLTALPRDIYGNYHALVIGVQNYQHLTPLEMAHNDAREVSRLLKEDYGFKVTQLTDPTRREILMALGKMRRTLTKEDNLLIYYAGHGWLDRDADTGYWLPMDAASDNDIDWLSLNSVISATRAIPAKHVMIVADSCFSGKLTRGLQIKMKQSDHLTKMATRKARVVLTSGGLEPVLDAGGGDHSVFAAAFLKILGENKKIIDGTTLFSKLRRMVMLKAAQVPEYSDIRKAGHEGGDFIFIRTEKT